MKTLYELSQEYADLVDALDNAETEEEVDALCEALKAVDGDLTAKADIYARIYRNEVAIAEAHKAEKWRQEKYQGLHEKAAERMKQAMLDAMTLTGIDKIPTSVGKWSKVLNPPACKVLNPDLIPANYHIPQPDKIDTRAILAAHKETGVVPSGCEITRATRAQLR